MDQISGARQAGQAITYVETKANASRVISREDLAQAYMHYVYPSDPRLAQRLT